MENLGEIVVEEDGSLKKGGRKKKKDTAGFRKAPQAPKRFKSPYILFSMAKMEEFKKEEGGTAKVTSVSRRVAEAWRNLSSEERKKWDEVAKQDKIRYNAEKSLYTGPWQVPSKRTRKDPSAPKRPMSAFLFFSQGMRQKLKKENPTMKNTEISCLLGERWKNAPEEERRPHIEREKQEREQYKKVIAEWRKRKDEEDKAVRKRRQEIAEQFVKSGYFQNGYAPQWGDQWGAPQPGMMPVPYQVMMPGAHVAPSSGGMVPNPQGAVAAPGMMPGYPQSASDVPAQHAGVPETQQEQLTQGQHPPEDYLNVSDSNSAVQGQLQGQSDYHPQLYHYQMQPQYGPPQDTSMAQGSNPEPQPYHPQQQQQTYTGV